MMTGPRSDTPSRRVEDKSRLGRFVAWWRNYGQLVMGVGLATVAVACGVTAFYVYKFNKERARDAAVVRSLAEINAHNQAQTAVAARQACERALALGPSLAQDYRIRHVLTGANLRLYESLIPTTCPSKP